MLPVNAGFLGEYPTDFCMLVLFGLHSFSLATVSCAVEFAVLVTHSPRGDGLPAGFRAKGFDSRDPFWDLFGMDKIRFGLPKAMRFGIKIARSKNSSHAKTIKALRTRISRCVNAIEHFQSLDALRVRTFNALGKLSWDASEGLFLDALEHFPWNTDERFFRDAR